MLALISISRSVSAPQVSSSAFSLISSRSDMNVQKRVDISIMVICYASNVIIGYDRRTLELSNAPRHMKQDTNIIE